VTVLSLSSCSTFDHRDAVATVNGSEFTRDDLAATLRSGVAQSMFQFENDGGNALTTSADTVISIWVVLQAFDDAGAVDFTDPTVAQALATKYPADWATASPKVRVFLERYTTFANQQSANTLDRTKLLAAVHAAQVHVDSRYGYWDAARASIVPFI
jgi:hypothetical protein